ncbi:hypothetical protein [Pontibacter kalidii]|uniref:hypothetical protein n=1 Tax=Pontibacter kalidii TaxID=2592049 RepID=UPI00224F3DFB|nr:hypothetical protein [Pontibacter kalidii]
MQIDLDKGIKGLVVHHQPLTEIQLKRLLLIFDEVYFTPPSDNKYFLEKGALCYAYQPIEGGVRIDSVNGYELLKQYAEENIHPPEVAPDSLVPASILSYGGEKGTRNGAYQAIVMNDILPLFNSKEFENEEDRLLDKFEYAQNREFLKVLDYKSSDFYVRNSIPLKIAHDYDTIDKRAATFLAPLLVKKKREKGLNYFIVHPSFSMYGANLFPSIEYKSSFPEKNNKLYDYDRQFLSIIAKVNKKLTLCEQYNLVPIFLDQNIYNFFNYKVEKARNNKELGVVNEWNKSNEVPLFNLSQLIIKASEIHITDSTLRSLTIPEIVSYKEKCLNELYKLRKVFINDFNDLITSGFGYTFNREVEKFMHTKLIPDLNNYQKAQRDILSNEVSKKAIRFSVGAISSYIGTIQGLSPGLIALLGGTSAVFSEEMLQLSNKVRERNKKKYENSFAYFLKIGK